MTETISCALCGADDAEVVYRHPTRDVANSVCRRCGLAYLSPRPDAETLRQHYDGYRQAYSDDFLAAGDGPFERVARERAAFVDSWLQPGARCLEVGCSYGHFVRALSERGHRATGLDPSEHQIAFARRRLGLTAAKRGGIENLEASDELDAVAMFHVIEHVPNPRDALHRIADALRPGGLAILDLPHGLCLPSDAIEHWYVASGQHLTTFTPNTLAAMARRVNLEPIFLEHHPLPSVYTANLRMVARKTALALPNEGEAPRPAETIEAIRQHHHRLTLLGTRLRSRIADWRCRSLRIAVYGAGHHTRGLLDLCELGAREIALIVDDDEAKHGQRLAGIPIEGVESLEPNGISAVLISSLAAEDAIARRLRPFAARGIEIARIYGPGNVSPEPRTLQQGVSLS